MKYAYVLTGLINQDPSTAQFVGSFNAVFEASGELTNPVENFAVGCVWPFPVKHEPEQCQCSLTDFDLRDIEMRVNRQA